ncbi:MAG: RNA 2',3'-cyclic phosphodiesterase [Bifidobacteriaceae bacterium]|jgi:2'-5' RNA ligase|nr:RNA 2',3'-cyclic phosphodiesterase [Bifidobacteriaceae bacterium]
MRLFAAIRPPAQVKDHLAAALAATLGQPEGRSSPLAPQSNWHITLAFYGEVPNGAVPEWRDALERELARFEPFSLELRGAGVLRRRVGWIGVGGATSVLKATMRAAASVAEPMDTGHGAPHPHLTITRSADRPYVRDALRALSIYQGPSWLVEQVELVESQLGRGPANHSLYTPVATVALPTA